MAPTHCAIDAKTPMQMKHVIYDLIMPYYEYIPHYLILFSCNIFKIYFSELMCQDILINLSHKNVCLHETDGNISEATDFQLVSWVGKKEIPTSFPMSIQLETRRYCETIK